MRKKFLRPIYQLRRVSTAMGQHVNVFNTGIRITGAKMKKSMDFAKMAMEKYPTMSNALIYGGLYTAAEVSQQSIKHYRSCQQNKSNTTNAACKASALSLSSQQVHSIDKASVGRFAVIGMGVMGPMFAKWYSWIDKVFPSKAKKVVLKKTLIDQFAFTPVCVALFYIGMAALEGCKGKELFSELMEKGPKTFALDCCFWIPATAANFLLVPSWLRVTFVGGASFVWINILSWIKSQPRQDARAQCTPSNATSDVSPKHVSKSETGNVTNSRQLQS